MAGARATTGLAPRIRRGTKGGDGYFWLSVISAVVLAALPWMGLSPYYLYVFSLAFVYAILGLSQDLAMGWTGLFVVAPAAFLGIGAYSTAVLATTYGWNIWLAIVAGSICTALIAALTGPALLRLSGHFLVLGTMGFGLIVAQVIENWKSVTGGTNGIPNVPSLWLGTSLADSVGDYQLDYLTALAVLLAVAAGLRRLRRSRLGVDLQAIRADALAAAASGIAVRRYQLGVYVTSAAIGGLAGGLYGPLFFAVVPDNFSYHVSLLIVMMVVIGGRLSSVGIITASIFMTALPQQLTALEGYDMIIYAALVLLFVLFLPAGVAGLVRSVLGSALRGPRWLGKVRA